MFKNFPNKIFEKITIGTFQQTLHFYRDFETEVLISIKFPQEKINK